MFFFFFLKLKGIQNNYKKATKFVIELSVWILNCYQKLPQTLEADLIKSLQEKATVVNDSLKTLTQHINQLQTT